MKDEQILEVLEKDLGILLEDRSKTIKGHNFNVIYDLTKLIKETVLIKNQIEENIHRKKGLFSKLFK